MSEAVRTFPLWRCEFRNSPDRNLVAKFFRAPTAQDAVQQAKKWHGGLDTIVSAILEKEKD